MKTSEEKSNSKDQDFKTVVHNSDVLSWMIRDNVDELKGRPIEEIKSCLNLGEDRTTVIGRETEYASPENGAIITDSVFDVRIPGTDESVSVIVNIESQGDPNPGYPIGKRAEYYVARMVSSQKGREFTGSEYGNLRKVYSIWYIIDPRDSLRNTVTRYRMKAENVFGDKNRKMEVLDTFNIILIYVGRYDESLPDIAAFPAALFSRMGDEKRKDVIRDRFNISLGDDVVGRLRDMTLDEDFQNVFRREGIEIGYQKGTEEGIQIGYQKGEVASTVRAILFISKEMNTSAEEVLSTYPIPDQYREAVEAEVRKRLS